MQQYDVYNDGHEILVYFLTPLVLVGNVVVTTSAFVVIRRGGELCVAYLCLCNIALADFVNSIAIIAGLLYQDTMRKKYLCAAQTGIIVCCNLASMLSICLLAAERFHYVRQNCRRKPFLSQFKAGVIIIFIWIAGFTCGLTPGIIEAKNTQVMLVDSCEFVRSPTLTVMLLASGVPLMIVTSCLYIFLYISNIRKNKQDAGYIPKHKFNSIALVSMLTNSYILTWGPYIIGSFIFKVVCEPNGLECNVLSMALSSPLAGLAFINFLLNICTYIWWYKPYHDGIKQIFCKSYNKARRRRSLTEISPNSRSSNVYVVGA